MKKSSFARLRNRWTDRWLGWLARRFFAALEAARTRNGLRRGDEPSEMLSAGLVLSTSLAKDRGYGHWHCLSLAVAGMERPVWNLQSYTQGTPPDLLLHMINQRAPVLVKELKAEQDKSGKVN